MLIVSPYLKARSNTEVLSFGTWTSSLDMLDRAAISIYCAYCSKNTSKQGLQLQAAKLGMSNEFYSIHGQKRVVDCVPAAVVSWGGLAKDCQACTDWGQLERHKDKHVLYRIICVVVLYCIVMYYIVMLYS